MSHVLSKVIIHWERISMSVTGEVKLIIMLELLNVNVLSNVKYLKIDQPFER